MFEGSTHIILIIVYRRRKMKKRIGCIILMLGIATRFTGCGGGSDKTSMEKTKTDTSAISSETSTSVESSETKSVEDQKDLLSPTRLGDLGWIDSSPDGEHICFAGVVGALANYQQGSVTNKKENYKGDCQQSIL